MIFDSSFTGRLFQVTEALLHADAVSNQIIALDSLLKGLGFRTAIFSKWHDPEVSSHCQSIDHLDADEHDVVLVHFFGFSEFAVPATLNCYTTRVLIYHNITPAEFFDPTTPLRNFCHRGREQLREMWRRFHFFWADSSYNLSELRELGVPGERCAVVPIVVTRLPVTPSSQREAGTWLYVGRIAPNKSQLDLIELFASIHREQPRAATRLYLVGPYRSDDSYLTKITQRIADLSLQGFVLLTGTVSDDTREEYYRRSSLFVSLSKHEGFGVPLIEAPLRGLPVAALSVSAVPETLGFGEGLAPDLPALRDVILRLQLDASYRTAALLAQQRNAGRFAPYAVEARLKEALLTVLPRRRQFRTVSVAICTYNRRDFLERVLDYLRFQSSPQFEVIVVDGPSDDGTKELLVRYSSGVKTLHNPERNLSKSRNLAIEVAAGDIIAFIDDDAIPFDNWIERILDEYNRRPLTTSGLGGPVYYAGTFWFQAEDNGINKFGDARVGIKSSEIGRNGWLRYNTGTNATFVTKVLLDSKGFDEQYDYYLDESSTCFCLQGTSLIGYAPHLFVRHEFAQSHNRSGKFAYNWYAICKNTAYFAAAHSGLQGEALMEYLRNRIARERVAPLDEAVGLRLLTPGDRDRHVQAIWQGVEQGLLDARQFPRTRDLCHKRSPFLPYPATASRYRVGADIKSLHICIVSKEFPPFASRGGVGTLYYHLASELLLMGHHVTVIVPADSSHVFEQGPFRVIFVAKRDALMPNLVDGFSPNLNWTLTAFAALSALHREKPIDIVEGALWDTEVLAFALLRSPLRPPLVVRLVTPFSVTARINGWQVSEGLASLFSAAERALIAHADAVVPISESIAKTVETEYALSRDSRWREVPCGISYWPTFDVNQGYATFQELDNVSAQALDSQKLLVFIGRLEQRKGIDLLLHAANRILVAEPEAQLLIAGRDSDGWSDRARNLIQADLLHRVHFMGEVAESTRDKLLARAYALLFPSRYESFGLVPLEAFVHGVPVIASRAGAIPEVVLHGQCGLLFDSDDSACLADAVIALLEDPSLRKRLSAGARQRIRELSSRNMALATIELYADLLGARTA